MPEDRFPGGALRWCGEYASVWQSGPRVMTGRFNQRSPFSSVRFATSSKVPMNGDVGQLMTEDFQKDGFLQFPDDRMKPDQRALGIAEPDRRSQPATDLDRHLIGKIRQTPGFRPAGEMLPVWR